MNSALPDLNDPDAVLHCLHSPLSALHDAYSHGVEVANEIASRYFQNNGFEAMHWSHSVRHGARDFLLGLGPSEEWELNQGLSNSGIELHCGPLVLRVWKARNDRPPAPASERSRDFCRQLRFEMDVPVGGNLIVDWSIDGQQQLTLALSRPKTAWDHWDQAALEWRSAITVQDDGAVAFAGTIEREILVKSVLDFNEASGEDA